MPSYFRQLRKYVDTLFRVAYNARGSRSVGMAKAKKVASKQRGRGRPPSNLDWQPIGVRFLPDEKASLAQVARGAGLSQAEFIRRATLKELAVVKQTGRVEFPVSL